MLVNMIQGFTRMLGRGQGFQGLPVRDDRTVEGYQVMASSWSPTPIELEHLKAGAPIYLFVLGHMHPPVSLQVGPLPEDVNLFIDNTKAYFPKKPSSS